MLRKLGARLTYANVMSTIAVFGVLAGGTAYAANTVFSADIVDGEVKSADIGNGEVNSADVKDNSLTTFDVSTFLGSDVVDGTLTGDDVADTSSLSNADINEEQLLFNDTLNINDIGSQAVGADEVVNDSLLQSDIRAGAVTNDEVLNNTLISADIQNGSLNDEDIGQGTFVNFAADIGNVPAFSCIYAPVTGVSAGGDHLLLTASNVDSAGGVIYSAEYLPVGTDYAYIRACNPSGFAIPDGTTHFNLLVIDAQ